MRGRAAATALSAPARRGQASACRIAMPVTLGTVGGRVVDGVVHIASASRGGLP